MPNRLLRESITTSETVNELSAEEEVFFYRLIVVCDDYGYMDARPAILKARCFPLREVSHKSIIKWLATLSRLDFITLYEHDGRPYLAVKKWEDHQRIRNQHAKYPAPTDDNSRSIDSKSQPVAVACVPESNPIQSESESSVSGKPDAHPAPPVPSPKTQAREILEFLNAKTGKAYQPVDANLDLVVARLREGATPAQCRQVIAKKAREWLGDEKMAEFLRPATLFNRTKFAQYVGELVP